MSIRDAVIVLTNHNKWRRGADIPPTNSYDLGVALDLAINILSLEVVLPKSGPKNDQV